MSGVKIQKVDHVEPEVHKPVARHKSMRTFPHGVMKGTRSRSRGGATSGIVPVKDPAKPPPVRKGTLRILTKKGAETRRKTIKQSVKSLSDGDVRIALKKANINVNPKTPAHLARELLEGGMEAGMIVVK
jgi:hypothetical protein